jgi:hypothetical protein
MLLLWYIMYRRANAKWTVNECLRLEREFDLLGLSIQEIAKLHERSPNAIMYKLDYEGIADYNDIFQNRQEKTYKSQEEADAIETENEEADASEVENEAEDSEYDEPEEDNNNEEDADEAVSESDNEYESYNFGQHIKQIAKLTKQVAYLTKIVYDAFTSKNTTKSFHGQSFAGFH